MASTTTLETQQKMGLSAGSASASSTAVAEKHTIIIEYGLTAC